MTLLDIARSPALHASILVMIFGLAWRVSAVLLLPRRPDLAAPGLHARGAVRAAATTIVTRSVPRPGFRRRTAAALVLSYAFHLGLLVILIGGAPHILLFTAATGLSWPALPKGLVDLASGVTLAALLLVLARRLMHPVLRLLSGPDDYLSLALVILPVLTGILLANETFGRYEPLLAAHMLSVEALMIWLPFGKLAHVVFVFLGRASLGAKLGRRGAMA